MNVVQRTDDIRKQLERDKESQRGDQWGKMPKNGRSSKHVIFLGAGASKGSGYPLANDLRLLISSRKNWLEKLTKYQVPGQEIASLGVDLWNRHEGILTLFRNGGFATLDEFCKLAGTSPLKPSIDKLRGFVRAALGIFNPEEHFESSEYYSFVQSLFEDDLISLRDDITVLTYNYDPYLEFLLYRALRIRRQVRQKAESGYVVTEADRDEENEHERQLNAVTSGLHSHVNRNWLTPTDGKPRFCVLQLHGSICFPDMIDQVADYETLFQVGPSQRAQKLFAGQAINTAPPILFPWEIMDEKGIVTDGRFPFNNNNAIRLLFHGIWERARREVQSAKRISFVGLSMHSFLKDGMKYLFDGKVGPTEIVVANPDNPPVIPIKPENLWANMPHTSAYTIFNVLKEFAPELKHAGISPGVSYPGGMTLAHNFGEFITKYMRPINT